MVDLKVLYIHQRILELPAPCVRCGGEGEHVLLLNTREMADGETSALIAHVDLHCPESCIRDEERLVMVTCSDCKVELIAVSEPLYGSEGAN